MYLRLTDKISDKVVGKEPYLYSTFQNGGQSVLREGERGREQSKHYEIK